MAGACTWIPLPSRENRAKRSTKTLSARRDTEVEEVLQRPEISLGLPYTFYLKEVREEEEEATRPEECFRETTWEPTASRDSKRNAPCISSAPPGVWAPAGRRPRGRADSTWPTTARPTCRRATGYTSEAKPSFECSHPPSWRLLVTFSPNTSAPASPPPYPYAFRDSKIRRAQEGSP